MDEYIKREAALALVRPDAPEDEKAAVTIATAKKLVRSILHRAPAADVEPVVHGRWDNLDGYKARMVCSVCGWDVPEYGKYFIATAPTAAREWTVTKMAECIDRGTAIAKLTALEVTKPSATMTDAKRLLADMSGAKAVSLHDIYRVIAGHSYYHGDSILAALTCIVEGKEVNPVRPADVAPVVYCCHCRSYNKPRLGWCSFHMDRENYDDFCSYGVRMDGDAE